MASLASTIDWTVTVGNLLTLGALGAAAIGLYFATRYEIRLTRHEANNHQQRLIALDEKVDDTNRRMEAKIDVIDNRLRKVEMENVAGLILRQDFKDFQSEIAKKLEENRTERRADIRGIHTRLNDLLMLPRLPKDGAE